MFYYVPFKVYLYLTWIFFLGSENSPLIFKIYYCARFLFILLIVVYQFKYSTRIHSEVDPVSSERRLLNWIIDLFHIITFTATFIYGLLAVARTSGGIRFSDFHAYFIYAIFIFLYYFLNEIIFLQTPGKIFNGVKVSYKGNRFKAILIRTLVRFVPFYPISLLLSNVGWHDQLSDTRVIKLKAQSTLVHSEEE